MSIIYSVENKNPLVGGDLGWDPIQVTISPKNDQGRDILWSGLITLPEPSIDKNYRLVVREFEFFGSQNSKRGRVVYAETLEL